MQENVVKFKAGCYRADIAEGTNPHASSLDMGFFQRLFSADYRKAVAAEAAGDFIEAARLYALCHKDQKVSDMHLAQARREDSLVGRVRSLRNALDFAGDDDGRQTLIRRLLAEALRRQGKRQGAQTDEGHQNLVEAAEHFDASHRHETAGEVFLEAGETARAVDAFSKAGLVGRVEALLAQDEAVETRRRRVDDAFKDYEAQLIGGQRDQALASLQICIAEAPEKGEYRRLFAHLEDRLLRDSHVDLNADGRRLRVVGLPEMVLGRDGSCDGRVRGPSVSRRHTRILYQGGQFWVEDAGSRNGTLLAGLPIGDRVVLPEATLIGLGESAVVEVRRLEASPTPALLLRVTQGMDRDAQFLFLPSSEAPTSLSLADARFPPLLISFREGRPQIATDGRQTFLLNGQRVLDAVQLITGDDVQVGDLRVRVEH